MRNALTRFPEFESLFGDILQDAPETSFPHYDIIKGDDGVLFIDVAVAGFKRQNLDVSLENSVLTISGTKERKEDRAAVGEYPQEVYTHRGIARRSFTKRFTLGEHLKVYSASLEDGILRVEVHKEIPEAMKPKQIPILG